MESSTAQFLMRQFACVQLPNKMDTLSVSQRHQKAVTPGGDCAYFLLLLAGGSCVSLSPEWELAGETQVAVLCPADCVEGLP